MTQYFIFIKSGILNGGLCYVVNLPHMFSKSGPIYFEIAGLTTPPACDTHFSLPVSFKLCVFACDCAFYPKVQLRTERYDSVIFLSGHPVNSTTSWKNNTIMFFFNMLNYLCTELTVWTSWNNYSCYSVNMSILWVYVSRSRAAKGGKRWLLWTHQ